MDSLERILSSKPGTYLYAYHDTGVMGANPVVFQVVRVNRRTITVRTENGGTVRKEPTFFCGIWTEPGKYGQLEVPEAR